MGGQNWTKSDGGLAFQNGEDLMILILTKMLIRRGDAGSDERCRWWWMPQGMRRKDSVLFGSAGWMDQPCAESTCDCQKSCLGWCLYFNNLYLNYTWKYLLNHFLNIHLLIHWTIKLFSSFRTMWIPTKTKLFRFEKMISHYCIHSGSLSHVVHIQIYIYIYVLYV